MLDHASAVAPRDSRYDDGPLRAYERYRTEDPAQAAVLSAAVLSANQLVVRDHDRRFEATCRAVRVHSASLLYMTYSADVVVDRGNSARRDYLAILLPVSGRLSLRHQGHEFDILAGETAGVTCSRDTMHAQLGPRASVLALCVDLRAVELALGNLLLEPPPTDLRIQSGRVAGPAQRSLTGTAELLAASHDGKDPGSPPPARGGARLRGADPLHGAVLRRAQLPGQAPGRAGAARPAHRPRGGRPGFGRGGGHLDDPRARPRARGHGSASRGGGPGRGVSSAFRRVSDAPS